MGKTIVITGAGTGIGRAIAQHLAQEDFELILLGRNLDRLQETRQSLSSPDVHQCFSCDIRKPEEIQDALENSKATSVYALIANAGVGGENESPQGDRWQEVIDINLTGTYNTIKACLPCLKRDGEGYKKIVIMSSILARLGVPGYSAYCASKAGLLGLMRSVAAELSGDNILVNAICPGWVNTDMAQQGIDGFAQALNISKEEAYKKAMSEVPLGKMSQPREIADLVAYLVSPDQESITGQTFDINNGAIMP